MTCTLGYATITALDKRVNSMLTWEPTCLMNSLRGPHNILTLLILYKYAFFLQFMNILINFLLLYFIFSFHNNSVTPTANFFSDLANFCYSYVDHFFFLLLNNNHPWLLS